jgi:hypothetical protein
MQFKPATDYTRECFNRYGFKPFDAVEECTMHEPGFVLYDLTVLKHHSGWFLAAHGATLCATPFQSRAAARRWLTDWYAANRQPVAA